MSFWGMFAGSSNSNDLPSSGSLSTAPLSRNRQQQEASSGPPPQSAAAPPTTTAGPPPTGPPPTGPPPTGPPPTANTYLHTPLPLHSPVQSPHAMVRTPLPASTVISTFQIFTPNKSGAEEMIFSGNTATADAELDDEVAQHDPVSESADPQTNAVSAVPSTSAYLPNAQSKYQPPAADAAVLPIKEVEESSEDESYNDDDEDDGEQEWEWDEYEDEEANSKEEREAIPASIPQGNTSMRPFAEEDRETLLSNTLTTLGNNERTTEFALRRMNSASPSTLAKVESPNKRSRFRFLTTESIIPKLEESSTKRRHEYRTRLYDMDCQLAGLEASCAEESLDRNESLHQAFPKVCRQLERTSDRFIGNKLQMDEEKDRILQLQRRVARIHGSTVQHKHETMIGCMTEDMESIRLDLIQSIQPSIQMEAAKADKREGSLFRKFDSLAGTVSRRFHEERATRKTVTMLLEEQMAVNTMEQQFHFLEHIQTLRAGLRVEREARKERDSKVLSDVHETCSSLRRAVLEAAGDRKEQQAVVR